jgi:hypothetical protein
MIGYAFPDSKIKEILYKNSEVIFIDEKGFWGFNIESETRVLLTTLNNFDDLHLFDSTKAKKYLEWYMPLWTRWVPHADQYENKKEESLIKIYNIFSMLNCLNIDGVIFNTSVVHHLDSSFLSIACHLKKIDQIYLYAQTINGRLLPILQTSDIQSRQRLNLEVSNYSFEKELKEFLKNKEDLVPRFEIEENSPFKKKNIYIEYFFKKFFKNWNKNYLIALLFLIRRKIYSLIVRTKTRNLQINYLTSKNLESYSTLEDFRQINIHRLFLRNLSSKIISKNEIKNLKSQNKPFLLIAAHYQPEATSFPEGDKYHNHVNIAMLLREKKYRSPILYKEHPHIYTYLSKYVGLTKVGISRSVNYLKILNDLGCKFLPTTFDLSLKNDNDWYVPVTITGTIALERSLAGLHTIYTGNPWYKGLPGTIYIDDVETLDQIPPKWCKKDYNIKKEAMIFMNEILNHKTFSNVSGIASGQPEISKNNIEDFKKGISKTIEWFKSN